MLSMLPLSLISGKSKDSYQPQGTAEGSALIIADTDNNPCSCRLVDKKSKSEFAL